MGDARPVLMQLIEEKLLTPGAKKLYVSYYRKRVYADLLADGSIRFKDTIYISPVPCALQMKRTLNPSLKTDAGWSTMYSAASGESLKDIKDRLNIRKRGPNSRTVNKDKKLHATGSVTTTTATTAPSTATATVTTKDGSTDVVAVTTTTTARQSSTSLRCGSCKKDASTDSAVCTACKGRTHLRCAYPTLTKAPTSAWYCDTCLTDQANRILSFLELAKRVMLRDQDANNEVEEEPVPSQDQTNAEETAKHERLIRLLDQLIDQVSSRDHRTEILNHTTGAMLVHLAKTQLVQLVASGHDHLDRAERELAEVESHPKSSEMDHLLRLFDLRHEVLRSQEQFARTSLTLRERAERRLRTAENELMTLEDARVVESTAVTTIANLIDQYTSDLKACQERTRLNQVLLESVTKRRQWIRSENLAKRFVPAYHLCAKQMIASSDQLLVTVLLDKLRDVAQLVAEWDTMTTHFETMTERLQRKLASMGDVVKREGAPSSSPVALFARVKIPPSRRLIERQMANYAANLAVLSANRTRIRRTLAATLKIARDENLGDDVTMTASLLLTKCGGDPNEGTAVEKEEVVVEVDEVDQQPDDDDTAKRARAPGDDGELKDGRDAKRQRVESDVAALVVQDGGSSQQQDAVKVEQMNGAPSTNTTGGREGTIAVDDSNDDEDQNDDEDDSSDDRVETMARSEPMVAQTNAVRPVVSSIHVKQEILDRATRPPAPQQQHQPPMADVTHQQRIDSDAVRRPGLDSLSMRVVTNTNDSSLWGATMANLSQAPPQQQQQQQPVSSSATKPASPYRSMQGEYSLPSHRPTPSLATSSGLDDRATYATSEMRGYVQPPYPGMRPQPTAQAQQQQSPPPPFRYNPEQQRYTHGSDDTSSRSQQQQHVMDRNLTAYQGPQPSTRGTSQLQPRPQPPPLVSPPRPSQASSGYAAPQVSSGMRSMTQQHPAFVSASGANGSSNNTNKSSRDASSQHRPSHGATSAAPSASAELPQPGLQQSSHGYAAQQFQQQQQQQYQRFQQQQQQQTAHHRTATGASLYPGMDKPTGVSSSSSVVPSPQDLFGNHSQDQQPTVDSHHHPRTSQPRPNQQPQTQQQHAYHQQQSQSHLLHHPHHLNPANGLGHSLMGSFGDANMRSSGFLPASEARTTQQQQQQQQPQYYGDTSGHSMHSLMNPHSDVYGMGNAAPHQSSLHHHHHLYQPDGRPPGAQEYQAHFSATARMYRDPNESHGMPGDPTMDPSTDLSEWQ